MKKHIKSILALAMSATAVIGMTACENEKSETSETTAPPETTVAVTTEAPSTEATPDSVNDGIKLADYDYNKIKLHSDSIKKSFDELVTFSKFRGAVYYRFGSDFEYIGSNGYSDQDNLLENTINTCYRAGSVTKQFTATAIMLLQQEGKLSTSDTLDKYYPDYKYGKKITIKNLLTMTSGIKDYLTYDGNVDMGYYSQDKLGYKVSAKNSAKQNKSNILKWILSQELNHNPDEKYYFSNSGYFLLGDIIEKVSGMSYEDYMRENIFEPLDMTSTGFEETDELALGYQNTNNTEWTLYPGVGYSSSGIITNVSDLLIWAESFSDNDLLTEESVEEMTTPYINNYGYGFFLNGKNLNQIGQYDKYNAQLLFNHDNTEVYIALSNYANSDSKKLYVRLVSQFDTYKK